MATLQHEVTVIAIPAEWAGGLIEELHDVVEDIRFGTEGLAEDQDLWEGLRLLQGRHLAPGARYRIEHGEPAMTRAVQIIAWDRAAETAASLTVGDHASEVLTTVRLRSADRPVHAEMDGSYRGVGRWASLRRLTCSAQLDLTGPGQPPVTALLVHPLVRGSARITCEPAPGYRWRLVFTTELRGRWVARPLASLLLRIVRGPLRRAYREGLEEAADGWNQGLPRLLEIETGEGKLVAELRRRFEKGEWPFDEGQSEPPSLR